MRKEDTLRLDTHALAGRIEALSLKQWWLARAVGVSTKTVGRWVNGRVKRIDRENAAKLARALDLPLELLILAEEDEILATREEQRVAATLLQEKELLTLLSPSDNWELAESLIRATMQPNLPLRQLGRLYNLLSITAWRQGDYEEGRRHAERARQIGRQCDDRGILHKAACNLATIHSFIGPIQDARAAFELCVAEPAEFDTPADHAAALSNLGSVYRELGLFEPSRRLQMEAIEAYTRLGRDYNLAIAWTSLFVLEVDEGRFDAASTALDRAEHHASLAGYQRGLSQCRVYRAELLARPMTDGTADAAGRCAEALDLLDRGLREIARHAVYDLTCHEIAARAYRHLGRMERAEEEISIGLERSEPFPFIHAMMLQEAARLRQALGDQPGARRHATEALRIFRALEIPNRMLVPPVPDMGARRADHAPLSRID